MTSLVVKLKKIVIKGLRGIRGDLALALGQKTILLYGDNGTGKSSITDALEWFYYDKVAHLSGEEISPSKRGVEALRNIFLGPEEKGSVKLEFNDANLTSEKSIFHKKGQLLTELSNTKEDFEKYVADSQKENLILRYKDLVTFITASKKEKLDALSDIIGFSEVTNTRAILKTAVNDLKRELKGLNFDNRIGAQQAHLIEHFGRNVTSDAQFLQTINELIVPLGLGVTLQTFAQFDELLEKIKKPDDSANIEAQSFYTQLSDFASGLPAVFGEIARDYSEYMDKALRLVGDIEKLNKIILENLLSEGLKVLQSNAVEGEYCPLCLQPKGKKQLEAEIVLRLAELQQYKSEKTVLLQSKQLLRRKVADNKRELDAYLAKKFLKAEDNKILRDRLEKLNAGHDLYLAEIDREIRIGLSLKTADELALDRAQIDLISASCKERINLLKASKKDDLKFDVHKKAVLGRNAHLEIKKLKAEKEIIERQKATLELIYSDFLKKQKQGIESFLSQFSTEINGLYQFMNPGEEVEDVRLIPLEKDDELAGITIQYKFFKKDTTPPHRFLSESHLNCLGIAFFLTSVKAFNQINGFFILDDVISSFDTSHRKRFADLLIEQFSDYQIFLLTHERQWFDMVSSLVKHKGWQVGQLKWSEEKGTYLEDAPEQQKERIEKKLKDADISVLGNDIRKYLEHLLKAIAFNLRVPVEFRFNDVNEDRMSYELLTRLKGRLNKQPDSKLKDSPIIDRLLGSMFIVNKDSHDSHFSPTVGDHRAFWVDVQALEMLTYCEKCEKCIAEQYFDDVNKNIRCGCGRLSYPWRH